MTDGWKINAEAPHGWSFKEFREKLIHETPDIEDFLRTSSTRKFIISAPKGFGKTLLLIAKSLQIRQQADFQIVSADEVVDRPPGGFRDQSGFKDQSKEEARKKELGEKASEHRADYELWTRIWSVCIMIAAIKLDRHASKYERGGEDAGCDPETRKLLTNRTEYAAAKIFTALLDLEYKQRLAILEDENYLARCFSGIRSQTALFIDNVDQFFDPILQDQRPAHREDPKFASFRHRSNELWKIGQLGLVGAAYRLHNSNSHVKVFCTIRREALSSLRDCDSNHGQILGHTVEIEYKREDLRDIFIKNIKLTEKLCETKSSDPIDGPMEQFFGPGYRQMMHAILDQTEPAFDFVLRHTFYRPRDLMRIGERIAIISPISRTSAKLKEEVRRISDDLVDSLKAEMKAFFPLPRFHILFSHVDRNILTRRELEEIKDKYVESLKKNGYDVSQSTADYPFWSLYKTGMLGLIRTDVANSLRQVFVTPREVNICRPEDLPPTNGWYLIHSALDSMMQRTAGDVYFRHFDNTNIIGNGNLWKEPITSLFALRGDICEFSRIMESEFYRAAIDKIYEWTSHACREIDYFEVSGGDSVLLIDKNPFRLVEAMEAMKTAAAKDPELPLRFRFGGAAGPISYKTYRLGETGKREDIKREDRRVPTGLALRTSSRLEPHAQPGTLIVDEHFKRLSDSSSKLKFDELSQHDVPTLSYKIDTGRFKVQKNEGDPAHETKLFRVSLIQNGTLLPRSD